MRKENIFFARTITLFLMVLFALSVVQAASGVDKKSRYTLPADYEVPYIVIKYREGTGMRIKNGVLISQLNKSLPPGTNVSDLASDTEVVESIVENNKYKMVRMFSSFDEDALFTMKKDGELKSKKRLADLNLYHTMHLPKHTTYQSVEKILERLNKLKIVEIAYAQPKPELASHLATPDYETNQTYLVPAPNGIDAEFAWTVNGGRGEGIKIIDVEGAWNTSHEDMPTLFSDSGTHYNDLMWRNHGTAVVGVIAAIDNGYGISGIANQAMVGVQAVQSEYNYRVHWLSSWSTF